MSPYPTYTQRRALRSVYIDLQQSSWNNRSNYLRKLDAIPCSLLPWRFMKFKNHSSYQISTRANGSRHIGTPSGMSNASWNSGMLDRGPLQRISIGPCGSRVKSWSDRSLVMFWRQHCALHEKETSQRKACQSQKKMLSRFRWTMTHHAKKKRWRGVKPSISLFSLYCWFHPPECRGKIRPLA